MTGSAKPVSRFSGMTGWVVNLIVVLTGQRDLVPGVLGVAARGAPRLAAGTRC